MEDDFDSQDNLFHPESTSVHTLITSRYFLSQTNSISFHSRDNVTPSFDFVPRSPLKCDELWYTSPPRSTENIPNSSSPFVKETSEDAAPLSGNSLPNLTFSLDELPPDVLETILSFLTFGEVTSLRVLCRQVYYSCGRTIRIGFSRLESAIDKRLNLLRSELSANSAISGPKLVNKKVLVYRCYNVLEMLRAELRMVTVLCRSVLQDEDRCFPGGHILDHFYSVLHKVDIQDIPHWTVESNVTCQLMTAVKRFLEGYQRHCDSVPLGVRLVDLLDILVDADYSLNVTYDPRAGTCHVVAMYELWNARLISLPRHVLNKETAGTRLTAEEIQSVAAYYVTMVRYNNRLLLREEQNWREKKLTWKQDDATSAEDKSNLPRPPREYSSRVCQERVFLSSDGPVVSETYFHQSGRQPHLHDLSCNIDLTCSLEEAPLEVLRAWNKFSSQIGPVSSPVEEESLTTTKQQEQCWPIEDEARNLESTSSAPSVSVYSVTCDLSIVLPDTESADEFTGWCLEMEDAMKYAEQCQANLLKTCHEVNS